MGLKADLLLRTKAKLIDEREGIMLLDIGGVSHIAFFFINQNNPEREMSIWMYLDAAHPKALPIFAERTHLLSLIRDSQVTFPLSECTYTHQQIRQFDTHVELDEHDCLRRAFILTPDGDKVLWKA